MVFWRMKWFPWLHCVWESLHLSFSLLLSFSDFFSKLSSTDNPQNSQFHGIWWFFLRSKRNSSEWIECVQSISNLLHVLIFIVLIPYKLLFSHISHHWWNFQFQRCTKMNVLFKPKTAFKWNFYLFISGLYAILLQSFIYFYEFVIFFWPYILFFVHAEDALKFHGDFFSKGK